ncbi:MAG: hypothetical protein BWY65_00760 [Firmicutes bacterium ADurb.Bin373]|nr:MAG: hypothetical protein BWY65_00760 [Firmicutes bacterium ADurb.Bin373]
MNKCKKTYHDINPVAVPRGLISGAEQLLISLLTAWLTISCIEFDFIRRLFYSPLEITSASIVSPSHLSTYGFSA